MSHPFIFLSGPTASGKSALALELAAKFKGVIFNCDSIQVYSDLNIGAAKPSMEDFQQVPHHLFNISKAPEIMTAAIYRQKVLEELKLIPSKTPVFVVGGTGFYFLALEKGLFEITKTPEHVKQEIQAEYEKNGNKTDLFWKEISIRDPEWAKLNHPNDTYRILRAMEIIRNNPGQTLTELKQKKKEHSWQLGPLLKIHLKMDPQPLEVRIRIRVQKMLREGLLDETQSLIDQGLESWAPFNSVGYFEARQYLQSPSNLKTLEDHIVIATRQLAKKQRTWFQRDLENQFLEASQADLLSKAEAHLARFLSFV